MGARGPLPQKDNVRYLKGNPGKRRSKPKPRAVRAIPSPPTWLSKEAKAEWRRITPELHRLGLLAKLDRAVLAGYCQSWSQFVAAERLIGPRLCVIGQKGEVVKHPAWQVRRDALTQLTQLAKELGLSPNARGRMTVEPPEDEEEDDLLD